MKKKLEKLYNEKIEQRNELNKALIESEDKEERAAIGETLKKLGEEIKDIEDMLSEMDEPAEEPGADMAGQGERGFNVLSTFEARGNAGQGNGEKEKAEKRAAAFASSGRMTIDNAESRAVLVSSGKIATPTGVDGINDMFNTVSSIVDLVKITDAEGMGAYKVAYQKAHGAAGTQEEGGAYTAGDPAFAFVEITPTTKSILSYISKQVKKQTPLNYESKVRESALVALRKAAAKMVTDAIVASTLNTSVTAALDEKALRKIALSYGGDENVVGGAVLLINKTDLIALGDIRGSDKKAVYEITPDTANPNTGIIKDGGLSVKYCIDSDLTAGTLIYGQPQNAELALFSDYEISVSEDFAFDKGLLAIRGDVELGCDVVVNGGFVKFTTGA